MVDRTFLKNSSTTSIGKTTAKPIPMITIPASEFDKNFGRIQYVVIHPEAFPHLGAVRNHQFRLLRKTLSPFHRRYHSLFGPERRLDSSTRTEVNDCRPVEGIVELMR